MWAAGVTYLRSKAARMEESDFSATAYDRVYAAERPEIFFKSLAEKVVPTGQLVGIRRDSRWSVPEPELALVLNSRGKIVGYTIGNDMVHATSKGESSSPTGKNLHRPARSDRGSPGRQRNNGRKWSRIEIRRADNATRAKRQPVKSNSRGTGWTFRSQVFAHGAVLLTGTGIVPPDVLTLQAQDVIEIEVSGIGVLRNTVAVV